MLKIELDTHDVVTLRAMSDALSNIAADRDYEKNRDDDYSVTSVSPVPAGTAVIDEESGERHISTGYEISAVVEGDDHDDSATDEIVDTSTDATPEVDADERDAAGYPWDSRIHSSSRAKNSDGSWKLQRKPKDREKEDWEKFISAVRAELAANVVEQPVVEQPVVEHPVVEQPVVVSPPSMFDTPTPAPADVVAPPVVEQPAVVAPPVVEQPAVVAPPVVEQPAVVAPPVVEQPAVVAPPASQAASTHTFQDVMMLITNHNKVLTAEVFTPIAAKHGVANIALLGTRPDAIPAVMADLHKFLADNGVTV